MIFPQFAVFLVDLIAFERCQLAELQADNGFRLLFGHLVNLRHSQFTRQCSKSLVAEHCFRTLAATCMACNFCFASLRLGELRQTRITSSREEMAINCPSRMCPRAWLRGADTRFGDE